MKVFELVKKLKKQIDKGHGDLDIYYTWCDFDEREADIVEYKKKDDRWDYPERLLIQ